VAEPEDLYAPLDYVYGKARLSIKKREAEAEPEDLYAPLDYVYGKARLSVK
jgi:hypothetical protein